MSKARKGAELPWEGQAGDGEAENLGSGLGVLGLKSTVTHLGGCVHEEFRTELQAADKNLGAIYI